MTIATSATSQNCIKKNTWSSSASTTHEQSPGDPSFQPSSLSYPIAASAEYPIAAVVYALCVSFCVCERVRVRACVAAWEFCLSVRFLRHSWAMRWECATKLWCKTEAAPYFDFSVLWFSKRSWNSRWVAEHHAQQQFSDFFFLLHSFLLGSAFYVLKLSVLFSGSQ